MDPASDFVLQTPSLIPRPIVAKWGEPAGFDPPLTPGQLTGSFSLSEIAPALVAVQRAIKPATKDADNPYFDTKYADLSSVWNACREALSLQDIMVLQSPIASPDGEGLGVQTMLLHKSGQYLTGFFYLPMSSTKEGKVTAQAGGSAITYARRYALAAFLGICFEDDDGNAASQHARSKRPVAKANAKPVAKESPKDTDTAPPEHISKLRSLIVAAGASESMYLTQFGLEKLEDATIADVRAMVPLLKAKTPVDVKDN